MNLVTFYIKLLCNGTKNAYSFKFAHVIPAKKPQVSVQYPAKKLTRHVIECDISQRLTCWRVKTYGRRTMTSEPKFRDVANFVRMVVSNYFTRQVADMDSSSVLVRLQHGAQLQ